MSISIKYLLLLLSTSFCFGMGVVSLQSQEYFEFPGPGWEETVEFNGWSGYAFQRIEQRKFTHHILIDGVSYIVIDSTMLLRWDSGVLYWKRGEDEFKIYDFTYEQGDTLAGFGFFPFFDDEFVVSKKERRRLNTDVSVWYMEILSVQSGDVVASWQEGVGDTYIGLLQFAYADAFYKHVCTRIDGKTIKSNESCFQGCACDYINGEDQDGDGYRNHVPFKLPLEIDTFIVNPQSRLLRSCDTIIIINKSGKDLVFNYNLDRYDDVFDELKPSEKIGDTLLFYNWPEMIGSYFVSDESSKIFMNGLVIECFNIDCDDLNNNIHPDAEEIPNNGVDENCDGADRTTPTIEVLDNLFKIYPNPTNSLVQIYGNEGKYDVQVLNKSGQIIKSYEQVTSFGTSNLENGIYFVQCYSLEANKVFIRKLVVVH